jgi:cobalamin biosynthesis protein CobC
MAIKASATNMVLSDGAIEPVPHGGDLGAARRAFPGAVEPFIDLSSGINPNPYPLPRFPGELFARLPAADAVAALAEASARAYGAPSAAWIVAAPGTQILLPLVAGLAPPGDAAVLDPSYGEHARAAALAGHRVRRVGGIEACGDASFAIVGNPNNPDGRLFSKGALLALAEKIGRRGGMLVVDEAFMDAAPSGFTLASVAAPNVIVLRSFGKSFGLAGLRLGFAIAPPALADRLSAALGPWAVSGPALAVGVKALADTAWIARTRSRLAKAALRLDTLLSEARLDIIGGTSLFRLTHTPAAPALFGHLGRAGIVVRRFSEHTTWLRFGLPGNAQAWRRLGAALASFHHQKLDGARRRQTKSATRDNAAARRG